MWWCSHTPQVFVLLSGRGDGLVTVYIPLMMFSISMRSPLSLLHTTG